MSITMQKRHNNVGECFISIVIDNIGIGAYSMNIGAFSCQLSFPPRLGYAPKWRQDDASSAGSRFTANRANYDK